MKIIVMDSANVRIDVLNVPDHMIEEDIEQFLAEHDYSHVKGNSKTFPSMTVCRRSSTVSRRNLPQSSDFVAKRWMMAMNGTSRVNVLLLQLTTMTSLAMWSSFRSELTKTDISPSLAMRRTTEATSMRLRWMMSSLDILTT